MRDFEALYHEMHEEEIEPYVDELAPKAQLEPHEGRSAEDIETLFEYMQGLIVLNRHEAAAQVFNALRPIIDDFRAKHPDGEQGLDYFYEWSLLALRLTPESRTDFVSLPLYQELFETFDKGPESLRYRGVQSRAQMLRHVDYWIGKGGNLELLPEEDKAFILEVRDTYEELSDAAIEEVLERDDYKAGVRLLKNAAQYFLLRQKPNDAIACFKETLEYLPMVPGYHESDTAEINMQLGQIFIGYGKLEVAKRYFTEALDIYERGGEELEMLALQAEGWLEETIKRMGKAK
ncbi:MAG: tetratricopeptide repeat protein [Bacteroidia bacterium]